ncbi:sporulation-delaying protein SdpB family protein [Spirosoma spitsbergense]|uniref:sporulation-delaying protein SdpB family protein n=1 Tax=Spirosoma spitsbergense TaxID=431554 RepID=UPI00036C7804|nr:sporulation-delaying protein SdpB family protein [Spirosoma spitsbergense]
MQTLNSFDRYLTTLLSRNPWTNVYGVVRSLLAFGTFCTLLLNDTGTLFRPAAGMTECVSCIGPSQYSLFCWLGDLEVARWVCIGILILVIIGVYPRLTALLHFYVSFSLMSTAILVDGGDQVTLVLSFLLLPLALTDPRTWHWSATPIVESTSVGFQLRKLIALTSYTLLRLQVALIYFEACVGKFKVPEWADGTAIYYWFSNPMFGLSPEMHSFLLPILANRWCIVLLTWGALILEGSLFLGLTLEVKYQKYLLIAGLGFHFMIILVHGLPTFFMAMAAGLIIFLRPFYQPFHFSTALNRVRKRFPQLPLMKVERVSPVQV